MIGRRVIRPGAAVTTPGVNCGAGAARNLMPILRGARPSSHHLEHSADVVRRPDGASIVRDLLPALRTGVIEELSGVSVVANRVRQVVGDMMVAGAGNGSEPNYKL